MSDFFTNLLNRHEGVGSQVRPRPNFIFEQPDSSPNPDLETDFSFKSESRRVDEETKESATAGEADMAGHSGVVTEQYESRGKLADLKEEREHFFETATPVQTPDPPEKSVVRSEFSGEPENALNRTGHQHEETLPRPEIDSAKKKEGKILTHKIMKSNQSFFTVQPRGNHRGGKTPEKNIINRNTSPVIKGPGEIEYQQGKGSDLKKPLPETFRSNDVELAVEDRQSDYRVRADETVEPHVMDASLWLKGQNTDAQHEPVINVTIGRVEVRATQGQTPAKPQKTSKPSGVMSLDEYLRQRESRSRK